MIDTQTGLMWASKDNGSDINWNGAKSYCENYKGAGYKDWRLPEIEELKGINMEHKRPDGYVPGFHLPITDLIKVTDYYVWSSQEYAGGAAVLIEMNRPSCRVRVKRYSQMTRALPVRRCTGE